MKWSEVVDGARAISWLTYVATSDSSGNPHVAVVAPGFTDGTIWFATRPSSRKFRNLTENPRVAFHWPVGGSGPGELFARGDAQTHRAEEDRTRLWHSGVLPFDLGGFWSGPDDDDLAFVECRVTMARLLGPGSRMEWRIGS